MNLADKVEARVSELETNPDLCLDEIFDTVCKENQLDAHSLAEDLGCKCPHGLIGYVRAEEKANNDD